MISPKGQGTSNSIRNAPLSSTYISFEVEKIFTSDLDHYLSDLWSTSRSIRIWFSSSHKHVRKASSERKKYYLV